MQWKPRCGWALSVDYDNKYGSQFSDYKYTSM